MCTPPDISVHKSKLKLVIKGKKMLYVAGIQGGIDILADPKIEKNCKKLRKCGKNMKNCDQLR